MHPMRLTFSVVLFCLLLAPPALAQEAAKSEQDQQALRSLLDAFLDGASRGDAAMHDRFWAEDLIYTSSSGARFGKADILAGMEAQDSSAATPSVRYWAEAVQFRLLGDTAVVAFRLMAEEGEPGAEPLSSSEYFNTGTFRRTGDEWRAVAWQATRIPEPE